MLLIKYSSITNLKSQHPNPQNNQNESDIVRNEKSKALQLQSELSMLVDFYTNTDSFQLFKRLRLRLDSRQRSMEEVKKDEYSVWALPDEESEPRFRKLMEALRSEFTGPKFDPHVTVAVATNLTADEAKKMFESTCDGLKAYTATVDRVSTGTFFFQCVFLLLRSTPEVMEAGEHCKNHFNCSTTTPYMPHLSLLYAELTEEEKKKAQEKAYTLDNTLDGLSFRLNRLVLCKTDTEDKTLESWERVAVCNLNP